MIGYQDKQNFIEIENQDYLNGMIQIYNGQDYYLLQQIQEIKDY